MRRYIIARPAREDLREIWSYLQNQAGKEVADRVLRDLVVGFRFLSDAPLAGHLREDLTTAPVRFWTVHSYFVIYDPESSPLLIARVLHCARDIFRILSESD